MNFWQFGLIVVLQLWILWRSPTPWRTDMILRRTLNQLNRIEAQVRVIPLAEVEKEAEGWWADATAAEEGRPWFAPRGGMS